jgi:hypothetical protein
MYEREHENLGNIDHLMEKKKTLGDTLRVNRTKLSNLKVFPSRLCCYVMLKAYGDTSTMKT